MRAYRWSLSIFLFIGLIPLSMSAQTGDNSRTKNFQNCMNGYAECNLAQLNASERQEAADASRDHNLNNCLSGLGYCDETILSPEIREEVQCAARARNVSNCLDSLSLCDQQKNCPSRGTT